MRSYEQRVATLREWMVSKGCLIHPHLTIPSAPNGVQGIGSNAPIPHKTLVIAIPSSLILTVTKCYNDPQLKRLFLANDDLFDYQATEDAEFNVLCVFLMFHKLNLETSPWKAYLETISEPETAIDWPNGLLKGLNRSMIEEILHVRRECDKLQIDLVKYLLSRREFAHFEESLLKKTFHYCYRAVMTRCFGYYFNQACLIPVADLINHGCQAVDHQLINTDFQSEKHFQEGYFLRQHKMDCELLGFKKKQELSLPFRERFLIENELFPNNPELLPTLKRAKINQILKEWNEKRVKAGCKLEQMHFCSQDEEEDNDTDEEFQVEQMRELENCRKVELEQMEEFMKGRVKVETYGEVEKRMAKIEGRQPEGFEEAPKKEGQTLEQKHIITNVVEQLPLINQKTQSSENIVNNNQSLKTQNLEQAIINQNTIQQVKPNLTTTVPVPASANPNKPRNPLEVQFVSSSSQDEEQSDQQQWGLQSTAYFTMSTSSPVAANEQLYNSYGSRTNKFLLIWYGFCYPDNLYDSVTLRLQVQFNQSLRPAKDILLDTYIGGQGLSFRKPNNELVKDTEVSRQFRIKRSSLSSNLLIFLRLYLMNYYNGGDLCKLFLTFPASPSFERFVLHYYRDIVIALYDRYPAIAIDSLEQDLLTASQEDSHKIRYKLIYLREQIKLLDATVVAIEALLEVLRLSEEKDGMLERQMWASLPVQVLRMVKRYLIQYQNAQIYIQHHQQLEGDSEQQHTNQKPNMQVPPLSEPSESPQPTRQDQWQECSSSSSDP